MIKTIKEIVREHLNEGVDAAMKKYKQAIKPVYLVDRNRRPAHCGTCFCLEIQDIKYMVTAAHVVDEILQNGGYVAGKNRLEPLEGEFFSTKAPDGDRDQDRYDFAWKRISDKELEVFGWTTFITEQDLSANKTSPVGHAYLAVGFPRSKNKKANPRTKTVRPKIHRYTSMGKLMPELFESLRLTGEHHIAIQYENLSRDEDGTEVNSIHPRGMSGCPIFDLGRKGDPDDLARIKPNEGRLAGIFIEKYDNFNALIAVKIERLIQAITTSPETADRMVPPLPPLIDETPAPD